MRNHLGLDVEMIRFAYPAGSSKASTATVTYAETTTTVSYAASGLENSRTSVVGGVSASRGNYGRDGANRTTSWNVGGIAQGGRAAFSDAGKMTSQGGYGWDATATYTYDPATGRKTAESLPPSFGGSWSSSYAYRTDGRLTNATTGGASTFYAYDVSGNLVQFGSVGATTTLGYDADNRLASRALNGVVSTTYAFDVRGRRTAQGSISYTYDSSDHLVHYHDGSRSIEATFTYDATGQRTHSSLTSAGVSTETTYTYDGLNLLSLQAVSGSTTYTISYLYDESSRPYAATYRGSDTTATRLFHLVTADRGDVIELLTEAGSPFASYRYDAWGNPTSAGSQAAGSIAATLAATIASRQPLRYATYAYDAFSGLYYLSARYYDPATMQFITKDPADADGEESAYQYCGGEPVDRSDPSGLRYNGSYRSAAWYYAAKWVYGFNPAFTTLNKREDCANFISQILFTGGLIPDTTWNSPWTVHRAPTRAWTVADALYTYLATKRGHQVDKVYTRKDTRKRLPLARVGDLMFYHNPSTGRVSHSTYVTYSDSNNGTRVTYHSKPAWAVPWRGNSIHPLSAQFDYAYVVRVDQ